MNETIACRPLRRMYVYFSTKFRRQENFGGKEETKFSLEDLKKIKLSNEYPKITKNRALYPITRRRRRGKKKFPSQRCSPLSPREFHPCCLAFQPMVFDIIARTSAARTIIREACASGERRVESGVSNKQSGRVAQVAKASKASQPAPPKSERGFSLVSRGMQALGCGARGSLGHAKFTSQPRSLRL